MTVIRVGDPHVKVSNLEESERLLQFVLDKARELNVDTIELLGDLFHTHAIVRLEVLEFWKKWLWKLSEEFVTIVLVGNHDQSGNHFSDSHALGVFVNLNPDKLHIIERPTLIKGIGYLPYIHDNSKFIKEANALAELGAKCLVSHTTYEGSKYDNGIYAPDGVCPDDIDNRYVNLISGHVHGEQEFGRVWYPGTARWDTASDANKRKGIWICSHVGPSSAVGEGYVSTTKAGVLLEREFISTGGRVCTPIVSIEWKEGEEAPQIPEEAKVQIELIGSSSWIAQQKESLKGQVSIRTKITDSKKSESRKAGNSLFEYLQNTFVSQNKDRLVQFAKEIGLV